MVTTKAPLHTASKGYDYFYVFVDLFSKYTVTVPTPRDNVYHAVNWLVDHGLLKIGLPQYLLTDGGTD